MQVRRPLLSWVCVLLIALPQLTAASAQSPSNAQADCQAILAQAEEAYTRGRFDLAITLIESCLSRPSLDTETSSRGQRLLALTYLAKDLERDAREAVRTLLRLVPDYQPDPVQDPPPFVRIVEELRGGPEPEPTPEPDHGDTGSGWFRKVLYGAGAAAVAVLVYVVAGGDSDDGADCEELPAPPPIGP